MPDLARLGDALRRHHVTLFNQDMEPLFNQDMEPGRFFSEKSFGQNPPDPKGEPVPWDSQRTASTPLYIVRFCLFVCLLL